MSRLLLLLSALAAFGCSSSEFTLQPDSGWPIQTRILSAAHAVDRPYDNSVRLRDSARVGMRVQRLTDAAFSAELRLTAGTLLRLQTRTSPHSDSVKGARGIVVDVAEDVTVVTIDGTAHRVATPVVAERPFTVALENQGRWTIIFVACVEVGRYQSPLPSSEWIIASLPQGGSALVADPRFAPLNTME